MSYNIDRVVVLRNDGASIGWEVMSERILAGDLPETCFLHAAREEMMQGAHSVPITNLDFRGACSGTAFDKYFGMIAKHIRGRIFALAVWEGGDSIQIWKIENGVFSQGDMLKILGKLFEINPELPFSIG